MLGHGREGVMGTRGEGERLAAFEPGRRKNGESRGRARHALWKEVRDAAVAGAMAVYDQWSRGGVMHGPLWPPVRATVGHWCGPRPKRIVTFLFIQNIQTGLN
jgi:hypothetical protein